MGTYLRIFVALLLAVPVSQAATIWTNSFANVNVRTNLTAAGEAVNTNNFTKRTLLTATSNALASATAAKMDNTRAAVTNAIGVSIDGSGNIVTPGGVNAQSGEFITLTVQTQTVSTVISDNLLLGLSTNWATVGTVTNFVADLSIASLHTNIANNLNFIHSTNGTAQFDTGKTYSTTLFLINNSGANVTNTWPATWKTIGSWASGFILTNGDFCSIAIVFPAITTSQTNNWIAVGYKQF